MLYKGGPKNYSKRDWQILGAIIGAFFLLVIVGAAVSPRTTVSSANASAVHASPEYRKAAERAGYSGKEADEVGEAAEKLCQGTGEC